MARKLIPIAVSARHAHLCQTTIERLFGSGYSLNPHNQLSQTGQFSAQETVTLIGPRGRLDHVCLMNGEDAARFGVRDCETVQVRVDSDGRDLIFGDVTVRVDPSFTLELHLDTDEANAAGVASGDCAELL